jgi:hemerythrin-like metal-binding protein
MRLPKWLYETLPYVYIVGGIATTARLQNAIGTISGLLLLSAGALVLTMRHNYRAGGRGEPRAAALKREAGERNGEQGAELLHLAWRPSYETGHEAIDRQHQRLLSLGNELITALMQRKPREDVELMLDVLVTELGRHLKLEEDLVTGLKAPVPRRLKEAHGGLLARANELRDRFKVGQLPPGDLVGFIGYDLIAMHVVKEDLGLAAGTHGGGPAAARHPGSMPAGSRVSERADREVVAD